MKGSQLLLWILSLTFVAVGLRNFELGLSSDAPLYATIGRNIVKTGEWWWLDGSIPEFQPSLCHPHLGFWFFALVFKILPAADWSARIPGIIFYFLFLILFFTFIKNKKGEKAAVFSTLILWSFYRFSNFFSNVYLDPGCLFFGFLSLYLWDKSYEKKPLTFSLLSGGALFLSCFYKGLTIVGFLPVFIALVLLQPKNKIFQKGLLFITAFLVPLSFYFYFISQSKIPDFFSLYWEMQMSNRFSQEWKWAGLVNKAYWWDLFKDSYGLVLFVPVSLFSLRKNRKDIIPLLLFLSFTIMYALTFKKGTQYWLMILPWIAWVSGTFFATYIRNSEMTLVKLTTVLCIATVFTLQYLPIRIHGLPPPEETAFLNKAKSAKRIVFVVPKVEINFLGSSRLAWYSERTVKYLETPRTLLPELNEPDIILYLDSLGKEELTAQGFCFAEKLSKSEAWKPCQS